MKVINIALRRADGKVENDTVYCEKMLTLADCKDISERFDCDVMVHLVGELTYATEEERKENSFVYNKPKKEEKEDGKSEVSDNVQSGASTTV